MLRDLHRQLAAGLYPAGQHAGDRGAALLAGHERLHQAGGRPGELAEGVGTSGDHDHDDRRAGGEQFGQQVGLHAGQSKVVDVAALARMCRARTGRRDRRRARRTDQRHVPRPRPRRNPTGRSPVTAQPGSCTISASGNSARRASRALGIATPRSVSANARQHVVGERVAAEERLRVGRARPDDGHLRQRRPARAEQRQRRSGVEQDDRPLGQSAGERAVGRPSRDRRRPRSGRMPRASSPGRADPARLSGSATGARHDRPAPPGGHRVRPASTRSSPKPIVSGSSTSIPAASARTPAWPASAAIRCIVARNGTAQ